MSIRLVLEEEEVFEITLEDPLSFRFSFSLQVVRLPIFLASGLSSVLEETRAFALKSTLSWNRYTFSVFFSISAVLLREVNGT